MTPSLTYTTLFKVVILGYHEEVLSLFFSFSLSFPPYLSLFYVSIHITFH